MRSSLLTSALVVSVGYGDEFHWTGLPRYVLKECADYVVEMFPGGLQEAYRWTVLFFSRSYHGLSQTIVSVQLGSSETQMRRRFKQMLETWAGKFGGRVCFNKSVANATNAEAADRFMKKTGACDQFNGKVVYCVDGSGTVIFRPVDPEIAKRSWCHWKHEYMIRWWVLVDLTGRIQYVSNTFNGRVSDEEALATNEQFHSEFKEAHTGEGSGVIILGDRGYRRQPRIGLSRFGVTKSGEKEQVQVLSTSSGPRHLTPDARECTSSTATRSATASADIDIFAPPAECDFDDRDGDGADADDDDQATTEPTTAGGQPKKKVRSDLAHIVFSQHFCAPRSVVERVIGRLKSLCKVISGPVQVGCFDQINLYLQLYCGIINTMLDRQPDLFTRLTLE
jgi:hypothetical protein